MSEKRQKCGTKDTALGLAIMFGVIAFFVTCAVQGWEPLAVVRMAAALAFVVMAPVALVMWAWAMWFGRRR